MPASRLLCALLLVTAATTSAGSDAGLGLASTEQLLFLGNGDAWAHRNFWSGWYNSGGSVEFGYGKRLAYDTLPIESLHFYDSDGAWAKYTLVSPYRGQTILETVLMCMGNSPRNNGGEAWDEGHCEIGTLDDSMGVPDVSNVLRLGVGDGDSEGRDWALFMLQPGNADGDFEGNWAYALGSERNTHTYHLGEVWMTGSPGTFTTSTSMTGTLTTSTSTTGTMSTSTVSTSTLSTSTSTASTLSTTTTTAWLGELLYSGPGSGGHDNIWSGWHNAGNTVQDGEGKRAAYDSLPLSSLHFYDDSGAWASFTLLDHYRGQTILSIVQQCMDGATINDGSAAWDQGHCEIGALQGSFGIQNIAAVLRLGVGDAQAGWWDWALFMLQTGNAGGDFRGNDAYALGSEGVTHTGHAGQVWMSGVSGSSTTSSSTTSTATTSSSTTSTETTTTWTTTSTTRWIGELLYEGAGNGDHTNEWDAWYVAGDTVEEGEGKRAAYDSMPLSSLHFYDSGGAWASFTLADPYRGHSLLHIVQSCMGDSRQNDGSAAWGPGHCEVGALETSSGVPDVSGVLRLGVGDGQSNARDWALFMLQPGNANGDFLGNDAYALGSESRTHTGHAGLVWLSGNPGVAASSTTLTSTTLTSTTTATATTTTLSATTSTEAVDPGNTPTTAPPSIVLSGPRLQLYREETFQLPLEAPLLFEGDRVYARQSVSDDFGAPLSLERVVFSTSSDPDDTAAVEANLLPTVQVLALSSTNVDFTFPVPRCDSCFLHVQTIATSAQGEERIDTSLYLKAPARPSTSETIMSGIIDLLVDQVVQFLNDPLMQEAVATTIRQLAGLDASLPVAVGFSLNGRRLRGLAAALSPLRATYSAVLSNQQFLNASNALSAATSSTINQQLQQVVSSTGAGNYSISVTGHSPPAVPSSTGESPTENPGTAESSESIWDVGLRYAEEYGHIAGPALGGLVFLITVVLLCRWRRRRRRRRMEMKSLVDGPSEAKKKSKSFESFRLQPVKASELAWDVLQNMLVPPPETKDTMHVGRDILPYRKRYKRLVLRRAWAIDMPQQEQAYQAQKRQVQADLQKIGGVDTETLVDEASRLLGVDKTCNEKLLLHGTKAASVLGILQQSIRESLTTHDVFGLGAYVAEDPSKSNQYTDPDTGDGSSAGSVRRLHEVLYKEFGQNHPGEVFYTFVCEVLVGCPVHTKGKTDANKQLFSVEGHKFCSEGMGIFTDSSNRRALREVPGQTFRFHTLIVEKGHDSVVERHREFVVFDGKNIRPRYLLAYSREE